MRTLQENAKAAVAFFTALATWAATAFADNGLLLGEFIAGVAGIGAATFGVWVITNAPTAEQLATLARFRADPLNPE